MREALNIEDLTQRAIDHAMNSIADGAGPLIPFTMALDVTNPDPRYQELHMVRYVGEYLEDMLAQAQASIDPGLANMAHVSMYALAWDGYATVDGRRWDAILVEAGTADQAEARLHAQRYEVREAGRGRRRTQQSVAVGQPLLAGAMTSRLWRGDR